MLLIPNEVFIEYLAYINKRGITAAHQESGFDISLIFATNTHYLTPILIVSGCFVKNCGRKSRVRRNGNRPPTPYLFTLR